LFIIGLPEKCPRIADETTGAAPAVNKKVVSAADHQGFGSASILCGSRSGSESRVLKYTLIWILIQGIIIPISYK
jgi:hypothetical protein